MFLIAGRNSGITNQRWFLNSPRFHKYNSCTAVCPADLYAMVGAATIMATGLRSRVLYHRVEMACVSRAAGSPVSWIITIVVRHHLLEDRWIPAARSPRGRQIGYRGRNEYRPSFASSLLDLSRCLYTRVPPHAIHLAPRDFARFGINLTSLTFFAFCNC